jgi:D-alanyl-D-alanine carboxypeptidase
LDDKPSIYGKSAITIDTETKEIIYAKNIDVIRFPASTTKIVTAILLAQNRQKGDLLLYSKNAKQEYPYILNLRAGERIRADDAMDALLLFSGNDIAHMIAEDISGNIPSFASLMNEYVKSLQLIDTHFTNPTGLHDPYHYTTAYELCVIAREMYKYPWIMESSGKNSNLISTDSGYSVEVRNRNKVLGKNGCIAGKTGWTPESGRCFVALYEREGRRIAGVVMDSLYLPDDIAAFNDMETIIDFSYTARKTTVIQSGKLGRTVPVIFKTLVFFGPEVKIDVPLYIKASIDCYLSGASLYPFIHLSDIDPWRLDINKSVGEMSLREKEVSYSSLVYPVYSTLDLIAMSSWLYFFYGLIIFLIALVIMFICYMYKT